jgi:caffeoyl-CoA O-methyltransferase
MTARTIALDDTLHRYLVDHSVREPAPLAELRAETQAMPEAQMQIGPEQGQFMQLLVRAIAARRCLEVGVFTGYSSLAVALALPSDGYLLACDVSREWTEIARRYWERAGVARKIELVLAPAADTLAARIAAGERGTYDFAFIDADKVSYLRYYELALELLRPGGVIAVDNTLWSGRVADARVRDENTEALRAFNDALHRDERVDLSLVPIGDGVTLARKR